MGAARLGRRLRYTLLHCYYIGTHKHTRNTHIIKKKKKRNSNTKNTEGNEVSKQRSLKAVAVLSRHVCFLGNGAPSSM